MSWHPLSEEQFLDLLNASFKRMPPIQRNLWSAIQINPEKWIQHPYGDKGGGFWAVAIIGQAVIWYNDIEGGFNRSNFSKYGVIDQYRCNQDSLEEALSYLIEYIYSGIDVSPVCGPPQSIPD